MPLGLFVEKLQPSVGLAGYDILFAHFVIEEKNKTKCRLNFKKFDVNFQILVPGYYRNHPNSEIKF